MRTYTKSELARKAGVSPSTFRRWMKQHERELTELGMTKQCHIVPPKALRYICEEYCIDL